jgi:hypothetical protein
MTRDEAKAIVDGGKQYLKRAGTANQYGIGLHIDELPMGPHTYIVVYDNGAGGNIYTSNGFDEVWALFEKLDTPIEIISHGQESR